MYEVQHAACRLLTSLFCLNKLITRQRNVLACAQKGKIMISKDHYWKISGNPFKIAPTSIKVLRLVGIR